MPVHGKTSEELGPGIAVQRAKSPAMGLTSHNRAQVKSWLLC